MDSRFTSHHRGGTGSPLVLLHGFTDTWRTWELVLPALERHHDVLAPTLAGHAGGPVIGEDLDDGTLADHVEAAMDAAGFTTAHLVGNSLGGHLALQLAARGRATSVVALAPAGGWADGDVSFTAMVRYFRTSQHVLRTAAPMADDIASTRAGRRRATQGVVSSTTDHIPAELVAHLIRGAATCTAASALVDFAERRAWTVDAERITCPVRIVWGTADKLLPWPQAAERYRHAWLPAADWVELDGVGHCPQLDVPLETAQLILGLTT